ncbi:TerD family protein [Streptomyces sp. NPDC002537]
MSVSLSKENVPPGGPAAGTAAVTVGLGWGVCATADMECDLDVSALLCDRSGKVLSDRHFVFYNNLCSPDGSVQHIGDCVTGGGDGLDDEQILIHLSALPAEVARIAFPVSIHEADKGGRKFGQVSGAFVRVVDQADGREIARCDLTQEASTEAAVVFGEIFRHGASWEFRAIGRGYSSGLPGIARDFGVSA